MHKTRCWQRTFLRMAHRCGTPSQVPWLSAAQHCAFGAQSQTQAHATIKADVLKRDMRALQALACSQVRICSIGSLLACSLLAAAQTFIRHYT